MKNLSKNRIIVTKTAGFCMGVKRAVELIDRIISTKKPPVHTYGPLIHNPQVIEKLNKKGVIILKNNKIPESGTVVIRAHGITPGIKQQLKRADVNICDATCPYVVKVQRIISKYASGGYTIIIAGDKGHAEVESYMGYAFGKGILVENIDDIKKIPKALRIKKYCIVAQTTQDVSKYRKIVSALKKALSGEFIINKTICNATEKRQKESVSLSKRVDAMIVIGGKNSANTLRLYKKCKSAGTVTYLIERADDIDMIKISKHRILGITAGASTPKEVIRGIVDYLKCNLKE